MAEKRVPVRLSEKDIATIREGMERHGFKSMSEFLRHAAFEFFRMKDAHTESQ